MRLQIDVAATLSSVWMRSASKLGERGVGLARRMRRRIQRVVEGV